jgi:NAD-dependent dihydropyrimidine dehydrogenase PreA subunit
MGHINHASYQKLQKRLDSFAQGAPESETLYRILEILFSPTEAELVSKMPIKAFVPKRAAKIWKKTEKETLQILNALADKGLLLDIEDKRKQKFILAPTMAGFFEFSIMRTDGKFNRKLLSELFYQYLNTEEEFVSQLFGLKVPIARTLIHEDMIEKKDRSEVLDYEKASNVIETATCITVGTCYCRHKMEHMGKACDMPQDVCLTFNNPAKSLAKHGVAREINKNEAREILDKCVKLGLVQIGDNIQNSVGWICNCCGCCCEALLGYKKTGYKYNLDSNFLAVNDHNKCSGCGICSVKCPVDAITMKEKNGKKYADINLDRCIGCGVCKRFCPTNSITMKRKEELNYTPIDSFERCIMNAIEKGVLHKYIFDNFESFTQEMLRKIFSMIFELEPVKRIAISKKLRSKFLIALNTTRNINVFEKLYKEAERKKK